jgi:hypothetical protein
MTLKFHIVCTALILSTDSAYLKKYNMSVSSDSTDIANKQKVKSRFHEVAILFGFHSAKH